ncbi:MAG: hypothetical protein HC797_04380 [Anaerolineales bacterium]|nr:hypothetical protein [Anaerolineales bacterium]
MTEILFEEFSSPENTAGNALTLKMQAEFSTRYILANDIQALTASSINASIPQGFTPLGEMTFDLFDTPITDSEGVTHFQLQANQNVVKHVDVLQVFNYIRGNHLQNAKMN